MNSLKIINNNINEHFNTLKLINKDIKNKIHPDLNKNQNTEYLSKIVNNAKDTILKNDFS